MSERDLAPHVAAYRALVDCIRAAYPEADEETVADTVAGETTLDKAIVAALRQAIEREVLAAALAERMREMAARKKRLDEGAEAIRRAALDAMLAVGWKRLPMPVPDFTVTVADGTPKLIVTDEAALPDLFCTHARKPDRKAIADALKAGVQVPGAILGNAEPHLTLSRR